MKNSIIILGIAGLLFLAGCSDDDMGEILVAQMTLDLSGLEDLGVDLPTKVG